MLYAVSTDCVSESINRPVCEFGNFAKGIKPQRSVDVSSVGIARVEKNTKENDDQQRIELHDYVKVQIAHPALLAPIPVQYGTRSDRNQDRQKACPRFWTDAIVECCCQQRHDADCN